MDVHHPCFPPAEYRERYNVGKIKQSAVSEWYSEFVGDSDGPSKEIVRTLKQLYLASIDYTLDQARRIIQHLKSTDRFEETLVILTSDHGELFGEYGHYGKTTRLFDELIHIPVIVANAPRGLEGAKDHLVSLLDIPPLIHHSLGLAIPEEYRGTVPRENGERDYVIAEHEVKGDVIVGARSENWLYEGDEIRDEHRLYDMSGGEARRVDSNHLEGATVRDAVTKRLSHLNVEARYLNSNVNQDVEMRLEELGYK
jgi:membrane-anchored protein YejM (alkaline phosphatase superfamily)